MRKIAPFLVFLMCFIGQAQILTFDFNGLSGNEVSATSNSNDANLTNSTITRGAGLTASNNGNRFNAISWATTSIANAVSGNDYVEQVRDAVKDEDAEVLVLAVGTEADINELDDYEERQMFLADIGLDDPLEADIAFHTSILNASGNRFLAQLTEFISTALRVSIRYTNKIKGVPGADVQKHAEILDTIKSRNPDKARNAVAIILDEALELIDSQL